MKSKQYGRIVDISRARGFNRDVEHQGAPDPFPAAAKKSVAHPAARTVGADQNLGLEVAAAAVNHDSGGVAFHLQRPAVLDDQQSGCRALRGPGARRTHRGGRSCTGLRPRGKSTSPISVRASPRRTLTAGTSSGKPEFFERQHRLGNQPAGADFGPRMARTLQSDHLARQFRPLAQQIQRRCQPRRARPGDQHPARSWHRHSQSVALNTGRSFSVCPVLSSRGPENAAKQKGKDARADDPCPLSIKLTGRASAFGLDDRVERHVAALNQQQRRFLLVLGLLGAAP